MKSLLGVLLFMLFSVPANRVGVYVRWEFPQTRKHMLVMRFITENQKTIKIFGPTENSYDTVLDPNTPYTIEASCEGFFNKKYHLFFDKAKDTNIVVNLKPGVALLSD